MTAAPAPERLQVPDLLGSWRRDLLIDIDGSRDTTTEVNWLQGPATFVDLRQPAYRPDFSRINCAQDLTPAHRSWMAKQGGFAGVLVGGGEFFEWRRSIDLQPPHNSPDAGTLRFAGDMLIEKGVYEPYVEHWRYLEFDDGPAWALHLKAGPDAEALLVRVGTRFGWARRRAAAAGPAAMEIALGTVFDRPVALGERWQIERSSLPYREGDDLAIVMPEADCLISQDVAFDGSVIPLSWQIVGREGDGSA